MKPKVRFTMKVKPDTIKDIASRIVVAYRAVNKPLPESLRDRELWDLWYGIHQDTSYPDDHPRFAKRKRLFDYDHSFPLYPDGTNDTTMTTALRAAFKQAKEITQP